MLESLSMDRLYKENIFSNWLKEEDIDFILDGLNLLLSNTDEEKIKDFAQGCIKRDIPFGEFTILSDYVIHKFNCKTGDFIKNRDIFAEVYIEYRLKSDIEFFEDEINFYKQVITVKENEIFNIHINWFVALIESIVYNKEFLNLNVNDCKISTLFKTHKLKIPSKQKQKFINIHKEIHYLADEALKMYEKKEYFYFMTIYLELRSISLTFREVIGNIFLYDKLVSIYIDPITYISNRMKFLEDIKYYHNKTLLLINIKDFSKINLTYGAKFGDKILKKVANYIIKLNIENVYRIYADEFAVIVDNSTQAKEIFKKINENIKLEEIDYLISFYGSYRNIDEHSFEICEYAMIDSKKIELIDANKIEFNQIAVYKDNLSMIQKLKVALISDRMKVYKQPIYNLKTGEITKYECLMRVEDSDAEILSPNEFMNILESMAIYSEYTKSMIYKSFKYFEHRNYEFSINLALTDIENFGTIEFLKQMLINYPEVAKRCTIELLENEAVKNFNIVNNFFREMSSYGVKTALDDFGSGYSNFAYIFSLELDYIKIDGTIIQKLANDEKMRVLVKTVVDMAHSLDMDVVAEFVSNEEIFNIVKQLDIDFAQGYYISPPKENI
jgi:EAL domain-containing protein (putative c-di-GMP-specific phosphodiesterase class I)/GGDEF domain-containing protein